ncbi:MAG TPA: substrate-binding domain-containing protein [Chitinophagaceae bacterium]|nr:substrate-binding domain-containing protein [Chitinophagaceae bacterium]
MKSGQAVTKFSLWLLSVFLLIGCGNNQAVKTPGDTIKTGVIHISVDESFKPIIDSQISVFESSFPDAKIIAHYKPEAECIKDLMIDSIRMVIITRGLVSKEESILRDTLSFTPIQGKMAFDAIAVLVNKQAKDSIFDMADIRSLVKGTSGYKYKVVMDGLSATSTVRYAMDTLLQGQPFGKNVVAATSSDGVIDYVTNNKDAIGFVGVSWIGNKEDGNQLSFSENVKIASLECIICNPKAYVKPFQANIAMRRYPLVRGLHYILKENYQGLGSGFVNFLIYERGQLIFRRAFLWPAKMSFEVRNAGLNQ